ncbi:MAG: hypothetical protein V7784_07790 [Oceanospirillaceae bacterium]
MDIEYIIREKVIDKYLSDNLSNQELNEFEIYYLNDPKIIDKIENQRAKILKATKSNKNIT